MIQKKIKTKEYLDITDGLIVRLKPNDPNILFDKFISNPGLWGGYSDEDENRVDISGGDSSDIYYSVEILPDEIIGGTAFTTTYEYYLPGGTAFEDNDEVVEEVFGGTAFN